MRVLNACKSVERANEKIADRWKKAEFGKGMRWLVQWYEHEDGEESRGRLRSKSFKTRDEAEAYRTAVSDDQYSGRYINKDDRNRLYRDVKEEWLQSKHGVKGSSIRGYKRYMRTYVLPKWGDKAIGSITRSDVSKWVGELRCGTAPYDFNNDARPKDRLSESYVKGVFKTANQVMIYAKKNRLILDNPFEGVELPRDNKPDDGMVFLTYKQVELLADAAMLPGDDLLIRMLAYTGLRPNEMMALHVGDVDLDAKRIHVVRNFTVDKDTGKQIEGTPKTWEVRDVAVPGFLIDPLTEHIRGRDKDDYLFTALQGGPLYLANWRNRNFKAAKQRAKLDKVKGLRPYSLRHTYASLAVAAGCDVKTLQNAMGHKDATVTLNTYAMLWPDRLDEVANALEGSRADALMLSNVVHNEATNQ
nr:site-specific integrase [Bifidobacterium saguinibicoloris]